MRFSMIPLAVLATPALAAPACGNSHYLLAGIFGGSAIVGVEYNDKTSALTLVHNTSTQATDIRWVALDDRKKNLYVCASESFQSFHVSANKSLTYTSETTLSPECKDANFAIGAAEPPFTVFGVPYNEGCPAQAISVDSAGALQTVVANLTYNSAAAVHGLALSPDNKFVYSADDMGNAVWVHSFDSTTGVAMEVQHHEAPNGAGPRHLVAHPNGQWVYIVYEKANAVAVYQRDDKTGMLHDTNTTYPLLPSTFTNTSSYWADEIMLSIPTSKSSMNSPKYLIASTRSLSSNSTGYITALALDATTGAITEQLFLLPSTGSGGASNSVSPAPFSEEHFAITDAASNFLEIWQICGKTAQAVAHLGMQGGPANAVWLN